MQKDNLFDGKFTFLDAVKILLLIVTAFSTWNVVDLMTPEGAFSWVREIAALGVVEGAFLGFEFATANAKNKRQVGFATWGFFCSLAVIGLFAAGSGLLEFGGEVLLSQAAGEWLGLQWMARDVVMVSALTVLVVWIVVLASIYRFYSLADPDKQAELDLNFLDEEVTRESNNATRIALEKVRPDIASSRAVAHVRSKYKDIFGVEEMSDLAGRVTARLKENYAPSPVVPLSHNVDIDPELGFVKRVPPMEKTARQSFDETAIKFDQLMQAEKESAARVRAPLPEITRGEPILFKSAVESGDGVSVVKIHIGDELQAILCDDGKYNISEPDATYAFARMTAEELHYYQTGEEVQKADNFR